MNKANTFSPLPLEEWEPTKKTLHLFVQNVGKIRMGKAGWDTKPLIESK